LAGGRLHAIFGRMKRPAALFLLAPLLLFNGPASTQPVVTLPPVSAITFTPGSPTSTVNGQLAPGGRDLYYALAKAGQTMLVSIASEADISFQVYAADATLAKAADGKPLITGKTLPDAGVGDNAKAWVGAIPRDGNYLVAVGAANGGPTAPTPYTLTVSLQ
jgi:hypothetical protein